MVPPTPVLTNKKSGTLPLYPLLLAAWLAATGGCSPPGPSALLQGKLRIEEGRYPEAVTQLEKAASLLPKNALAWNYLGLAYHGNQQPEQATKAYRTALALDHKLSVVRYNLGCLFVEQTNYSAAIDELRSYTLLQPGAAEGWLRLGSALLRAHRLEEAERIFRAAMEVQPRHPEALNGLGLIQMQRRRWQEALNHFNVAALQVPPYPPALLNSAIVAQQYLNNRQLALQRYRQYLALQPRCPNWDAVDGTARILDAELNPPVLVNRPPPRLPVANSPGPQPALVSQPLAQPAPPLQLVHNTNQAVVPTPAARAKPPANPAPNLVTTRTNSAPPPTSPRNPAPAATAAGSGTPTTNVIVANARPAPEPARPAVRPPPAKPVEPAPVVKPVDVEVAQVASELVVKPAQELTTAHLDPTIRTGGPVIPASPDPATPSAAASTNGARRGFLNRLNPFSGKEKTDRSPTDSATAESRPVVRYNYLSPAAPTAGNRTEAQKDFNRGLRAHRSGSRSQAIADYQAAVRNDPAYYDAYYNLGLVALEGRDSRLSLWAYEIALALKPDSGDARYNFALALKSGGYWVDATEELKKILNGNATDVRSHLSLGNLYAQQLNQPQLARPHYERLLELSPQHPEANKIRVWLAAHR